MLSLIQHSGSGCTASMSEASIMFLVRHTSSSFVSEFFASGDRKA